MRAIFTHNAPARFEERVRVDAGFAWIGDDQPGEAPRVRLFVSDFLIDKFAVCNQRYSAFIDDRGYSRPELWTDGGYDWARAEGIDRPAFWNDERFNQADQPVVGVSFYEAAAFARWDGGRLATEIQWEKAARGADGRTFPWGEDEPSEHHATFAPGFIPLQRAPSAVDAHRDGDSPYGCCQMAGNVFEWTLDTFHFDSPSRRRTPGFHVECRPSSRRVLKGGAWTTGASRLRPAARWSYTPDLRDNILGFRLVFDLEH